MAFSVGREYLYGVVCIAMGFVIVHVCALWAWSKRAVEPKYFVQKALLIQNIIDNLQRNSDEDKTELIKTFVFMKYSFTSVFILRISINSI